MQENKEKKFPVQLDGEFFLLKKSEFCQILTVSMSNQKKKKCKN
jgi:hypothetical protein